MLSIFLVGTCFPQCHAKIHQTERNADFLVHILETLQYQDMTSVILSPKGIAWGWVVQARSCLVGS